MVGRTGGILLEYWGVLYDTVRNIRFSNPIVTAAMFTPSHCNVPPIHPIRTLCVSKKEE